MYHLRTINSVGEVTNVELGKEYTKVDVTRISKYSAHAQALLKLSDNEGGDVFVNYDSILIVSPNFSNLWLSADEQHYIIDSTGNTVERIKPEALDLSDWARILDSWKA